METKMIWGNLSSNNLQTTREFYTKLGFKFNGEHDDAVSFVFGENKFIINFFTKERLKDETNGEIGNWEKQSEVLFSLSAKDKEEVDQWREKILEAGGTIFSEPQNYKEGYTFCFSDPDGHKFNVLYWPGM
ncbi:hypothetical protein EV144_104169 [Flavobacterium sp. 270]|uniref:VOC family protein n=1 Tax=Flavobacterium sp. 270 TaxID=2512114 RepID=UPI001065A9CE|nr:VOC family protein [Flavobacterium sp. 270]TDW47883.1 hypothetical protein EV144_104169 [Flavobacterium sp. 270]